MNKKAIFWPTLAIATLFLMTYSFYVFIIKDPNLYNYNTIGDNQIALSNAYRDAENDLFYAEQAIKYSLNDVSEEFINNGGVNPICGGIWKFGDSEICNPDLKGNFEKLLKEKLKGYDLELENIDINRNIITIKLKEKSYSRDLRNFEFKYIINQEFKQESIIDFEKLFELKNKLELWSKKTDLERPKETSKNRDIIYFTIENNKNILNLSPTFGYKKLNFKFGINEKDPGQRVL